MSEMPVVLGDAHGEHIRLTALSRERAESGDYDDDNWLKHTLAAYSDKGPVLTYRTVNVDKYKPQERKY